MTSKTTQDAPRGDAADRVAPTARSEQELLEFAESMLASLEGEPETAGEATDLSESAVSGPLFAELLPR